VLYIVKKAEYLKLQTINGNNEPSLNLSQRAYVLTDSLRETTRSLFYLFIGIMVYSVFGIPEAYSDKPAVDFFKGWIPFTIIVFSIVLIWYYSKARGLYQNFKQWNEDYLQQAYTLIFDTTIPKGNTNGEKILNLARAVFPELRSDYIQFSPAFTDHFRIYLKKKISKRQDQNISRNLSYSVGSYTFDVVLKTANGYFIVKDFRDKVVTLQDLRQLIQIIHSKFKDKYQQSNVLRVICVAKQYDQPFLERESLERIMKYELKIKKIDLIVQEQLGYSVLWISKFVSLNSKKILNRS
jgi:hypothetical protein